MKKIQLLFLLILALTQVVTAQETPINNDAKVVFRPLVYVDYNFYHWVQEPVKTTPKNVGQVFNVLPGIGGGFIMGKKTTLLFSLEAAVRYMPFSLDLVENKGMGSVAFPVIANFRIPLTGFFFMQIGGGVQWTSINLHQRTALQQASPSPFLMTYIGEIAGGLEEHIFLMYFLRFGYHPSQAMTFDVGLKLGIHGDLWN